LILAFFEGGFAIRTIIWTFTQRFAQYCSNKIS